MELIDILSLCNSVPLNAETILQAYVNNKSARTLILAVLLIRKTRIYSSEPNAYRNLALLLDHVPLKLVREKMCWLVGFRVLNSTGFRGLRYSTLKHALAIEAMYPLRILFNPGVEEFLMAHLGAELDGLYQTASDRQCTSQAFVTFLQRTMRYAPTTQSRLNDQSDILFAAVRDHSPTRKVFYYST